jgi:hypothetical protein
MQYVYLPNDGTNLTGVDFTDPANPGIELTITLTNDTLDKAAWFAYYFNFTSSDGSTSASVAIPGYGFDGLSNYSFIFGYDTQTADLAFFDFTKVVGPGEIYDGIKIVRILLSDATDGTSTHSSSGRRGLPDIDFKDYNAVKKYYNLTDPVTRTYKPR